MYELSLDKIDDLQLTIQTLRRDLKKESQCSYDDTSSSARTFGLPINSVFSKLSSAIDVEDRLAILEQKVELISKQLNTLIGLQELNHPVNEQCSTRSPVYNQLSHGESRLSFENTDQDHTNRNITRILKELSVKPHSNAKIEIPTKTSVQAALQRQCDKKIRRLMKCAGFLKCPKNPEAEVYRPIAAIDSISTSFNDGYHGSNLSVYSLTPNSSERLSCKTSYDENMTFHGTVSDLKKKLATVQAMEY